MALMDLFAAQAQRCRHREQTCGHSEGRKGGDELRNSTDTYALPCVEQTAGGSRHIAQGVQPGAL